MSEDGKDAFEKRASILFAAYSGCTQTCKRHLEFGPAEYTSKGEKHVFCLLCDEFSNSYFKRYLSGARMGGDTSIRKYMLLLERWMTYSGPLSAEVANDPVLAFPVLDVDFDHLWMALGFFKL